LRDHKLEWPSGPTGLARSPEWTPHHSPCSHRGPASSVPHCIPGGSLSGGSWTSRPSQDSGSAPAGKSSLISGQHTLSIQRREGSFRAAPLPSPASHTSACPKGLWPCSVQSQDTCESWGDAGTSWQLLRRGLGPLPIPTLEPQEVQCPHPILGHPPSGWKKVTSFQRARE